MGVKKTLKKYIRDDRPLKLKSYVKTHNICPVDVRLGHRRNLLHYCADYGSADMLRCLLKLECDPSLHDKDGNLPLHTALQRGIEESPPMARETLMEMVTPLLEAYPLGQDVENKDGVTGHDLLIALKRKIKKGFCSSKQSEREKERVKEEENEMWQKKLNEEAMFEVEEQLPRYSYEEDISQERNRESFEEWSDRIGQEYFAKSNKTKHTFWRDKKRKGTEDERDEADSKKSKTEDDAEEKLKKAREEMRKNFKPDPVESKMERLLSKKQRYESKFAYLLGHVAGKTLTFACIPWPSLDLHSIADVLFCDLPDRRSTSYRKYLRAQQVRWHPDKFTQKFGDHIHPDHLPKVMSKVKAISQILNQLSTDTT